MDKYESVGVDYDILDAAKRASLEAALSTATPANGRTSLSRIDGSPIMASQGESAFAFTVKGDTFATVLECLGTKSVVAREYADATGENCFEEIGIDAVAAIVNDLICVGALPLTVHAYFSTGAASWYHDMKRFAALVEGWRRGCEISGAVWGGGESPTLPGLVDERDIELAGSAVGFVPGGKPLLGDDLAPGDEIVLVASSGLHSNGSSLVRSIAKQLPEGYNHKLPSGRSFGQAALTPSEIYAPLIAELLDPAAELRVKVSYLSHITGHGLRKLMRADKELTYRIAALLPVPEFLAELVRWADMDSRSAYGTLNMGNGFAIYCRPGDGAKVVERARAHHGNAILAGAVEEGPRRVILEPLGVTFEADELKLRADDPKPASVVPTG